MWIKKNRILRRSLSSGTRAGKRIACIYVKYIGNYKDVMIVTKILGFLQKSGSLTRVFAERQLIVKLMPYLLYLSTIGSLLNRLSFIM